jgi:hypothetical protein
MSFHSPESKRLRPRVTMNNAEDANTTVPTISRRNPSHSLAALLWKSILRLAFTLSMFTVANRACSPNARIVTNPAIVSEKWTITGAFVMASMRVNSRDVAMKYLCTQEYPLP